MDKTTKILLIVIGILFVPLSYYAWCLQREINWNYGYSDKVKPIEKRIDDLEKRVEQLEKR